MAAMLPTVSEPGFGGQIRWVIGMMNGHRKKPTLEQTMNSRLHQAIANGRCLFHRLTFEILYDNKKDLLISVESHRSQMLNTEKWQCRTWKNGKTWVMKYDTNPNFKKLLYSEMKSLKMTRHFHCLTPQKKIGWFQWTPVKWYDFPLWPYYTP